MWRTYAARFAKIVGAWSLLTIYNFGFDCILYPLMIYWWGPLVGGGTMAIIASVLCFIQLHLYNRSGKDWLGVDVLEDIKEHGQSWVGKLDNKAKESFVWFLLRIIMFVPARFFLIVLWAIKKNDVTAFVALNINQDPFVTTVFLRHRRKGDFTRRDWEVFVGSLVFSNGYWIARNVILIELIKLGWNYFN